jgi:cbb3-type cytochrome oxidase subunit 3
MRLSELMSQMGLAVYAEIGLVIFFAVFIGVLIHVNRKKNASIYERARHLPLDDSEPTDPSEAES